MLIYANFEQLDLDNLDTQLREKLLSLHCNNELIYKSIYSQDIEKVKELSALGFPINWKTALTKFHPDEKFILENFNAPPNSNSSDCTDDLSISFDNEYRCFNSAFYNNKYMEFNSELVDVLASFYFQRDEFYGFKFFYFTTSRDKKLTKAYIKDILDKTDVYPDFFNGLLFNIDSNLFEIFVELKKIKELKNLLNIFRHPPYRYLVLNENSYIKAFDLYIDEIIGQKLDRKYIKNVVNYNRKAAINEVFNWIYIPKKLNSYIYEKYESLTGVERLFTPVAVAYSEITRLDFFFDIEWELMADSFKQKYPKQKDLSKGNKIRKRNFLERAEKDFKEVFDSFCKSHNCQYVFEQSELLGIPRKYYPELYQKYKLENMLHVKDKNEKVKKI